MTAEDPAREKIGFYLKLDSTAGESENEGERLRARERARLYEALEDANDERAIARIGAKLNYLCLRSIADEIDWLRSHLRHAIHCAKDEEDEE